MATVNEELLDAAIRHQIDLARYSNGVVRRIIAILNRSDVRLFEALVQALDRLPPEAFTVERLEAMLGAVRSLNAQAHAQVEQELRSELRDFTDYEVAFQQQTLADLLPGPVRATLANVTAEQVYTAALARPFQGALLKGFLDDLAADKAKKIRQAVAQGYVEGKTVPQMVRELRGTRAKGYGDGIIEITRRNAEAVVRTAVGHMAGFTRDKVQEANADLIKALSWTATLDGRTSQICRARDGKQYTPKTHKPIGHDLAWLGGPGRAHWNCRSTSVPVLKSFEELGIDLPEFEPTTRASMDGQVPANLTYAEWLKKQPVKTQGEILGPDRAALFRTGKLPIEKFENDKGKTLTLQELKQQEPKAYHRAGLDLPYRPPVGVPQDEIARFLADPAAQQKLMSGLYRAGGMSYEQELRHVRKVKLEEGYTSSDDSLSAVRFYTGSGYAPINRRMRESGGTLEDRQFSALTVSSFPGIGEHRGEIWRKPTKRQENADRLWNGAEVGQPMDLGKQLQSFTRSAEFAASWGHGDLLLRIGRSKRGVYIEPLTMNEGEEEVLLPPRLKYRVVGKTIKRVSGREYRVVDLEIEDSGSE